MPEPLTITLPHRATRLDAYAFENHTDPQAALADLLRRRGVNGAAKALAVHRTSIWRWSVALNILVAKRGEGKRTID